MIHNRISGIVPALLLAVVVLSAPALARAADRDALADVIEKCDSCHGVDARIRSIAPVLDGLPGRYLEDQLLNFVSGNRGAEPAEHFTRIMTAQLLALQPGQAKQLARHYSRRKKLVSNETVTGNAGDGEALFEDLCRSCHVSAVGRMFTGSPPVVHLEGLYILSQLQAFASGQRNVAKDSKHKVRMVEIAGQLSPQQMLDITAFIKARFTAPRS